MLRVLENRKAMRVEPFYKKAAVHCASLDSQAISDSDKKDGVQSSWQKVKIDRQIVAIAQAARCDRIVTGDPDVEKIAARAAIETAFVRPVDLPLADAQFAMQLDGGDGPSVE